MCMFNDRKRCFQVVETGFALNAFLVDLLFDLFLDVILDVFYYFEQKKSQQNWTNFKESRCQIFYLRSMLCKKSMLNVYNQPSTIVFNSCWFFLISPPIALDNRRAVKTKKAWEARSIKHPRQHQRSHQCFHVWLQIDERQQ